MDPIVADGVRKSYGATVALAGVSLSVPVGEVFALIGPNGAGKTTLVRCLTGTTTPDEGRVALFGGSPRGGDRSRLGLLPQDFNPPDRLTARELLAYYAGLYDDARDVDAVLRDVDVTAVADTRYRNLSGGERRRVAVGTAVVNDPAVLLLDEPTTGIDPAGRRAVWSLVEALAAGGTTVFLTTHSMAEAERLADRVGVLRDGRLIALDTPAGLVDTYGGESRLAIDTDADIALDGYDVVETAQGAVLRGVAPEDIGDVVDALSDAGVTYDGLSWQEPDLESVYLELVGGRDAVGERSIQGRGSA